MQGFSGGKFCKSDESRLSWAAGESAPGAQAGDLAARGWAHAGGADLRQGPAEGRRPPGRMGHAPGKSICREEERHSSVVLHKSQMQTAVRHAPPPLGSVFRRPFNFLFLGVLNAQNKDFKAAGFCALFFCNKVTWILVHDAGKAWGTSPGMGAF